jgi:hypothetical protein
VSEVAVSFVRKLKTNQRSRVHIYDAVTRTDQILFETQDLLLEAPNWHKDGYLIFNGDGVLWKLGVNAPNVFERISIQGIPELNNDHVLSPDHQTIYMSAYDDWQIYRAPVAGGVAEQVSPGAEHTLYFLHGVSLDESELAYVNIRRDAEPAFGSGRIHLLNLKTGEDRTLVGGNGAEDGSEYSADGRWVYFNTEHFSSKPGHAQIARVRQDGSDLEQLTFDERVNWFPHQSLDGKCWVYLSYPEGTEGHPADLPVELRLVLGGDWLNPKRVNGFHGGQGTINVNSWNPRKSQFAYVSYPISQ